MNGLIWYKGIILGLIQGITEFFPVSSSAHLVIAQNYLGIRELAKTLSAFDVALHLGTFVAAVVFFRDDLLHLLGAWFKPVRAKLDQKGLQSSFDSGLARRLTLFILLGIIPAGVIGSIFHQFFEDLFSDTFMVAIFMLITGTLIHATRHLENNSVGWGEMTSKQALLIGLAQVFSILPGISRSGTTIASGLLLKLKPEIAFRFSFLMMIPVVGGAALLNIREFRYFNIDTLMAALFGAIVAGFAGYFCIGVMLRWMNEGKFRYFAYYCWIVGGLVILKEMFF